ncbi:response regulator transcription factor [Terriglobus sp.]|uniref:response regulator transcription factor n=1 Tax=Terriglobus sp. TaxID=1889013 RepID=UPI003B008A5B
MNPPGEPLIPVPITVLIADDHPLMRQGIRLSLAGEPYISIVGEAANGEEILECVGFRQPDIVILDLDMPGRNGLAVLRELKRRGITIGVIILTLHTGADLIAEALDLGVRGYIIKSSAVVQVVEAVRRVAGGGSYLSQEVLDALEGAKAKGPLPAELQQLTPLELRLVREIAQGKTSREIAAALDLSGRTIENYRTRICSKLRLAGPNALLQFALRERESLGGLAK